MTVASREPFPSSFFRPGDEGGCECQPSRQRPLRSGRSARSVSSAVCSLPSLHGHMCSTIALAKPLVDVSVAPSIRRSKSYVTRFCAMVFSRLVTIRSATSCQPM